MTLRKVPSRSGRTQPSPAFTSLYIHQALDQVCIYFFNQARVDIAWDHCHGLGLFHIFNQTNALKQGYQRAQGLLEEVWRPIGNDASNWHRVLRCRVCYQRIMRCCDCWVLASWLPILS